VPGAAVAKENADATKEDFRIVGIIVGIFAGIACSSVPSSLGTPSR
jgi:hypothetical protein